MSISSVRTFSVIILFSLSLFAIADEQNEATELMVQELESLNQFSAYGRKLYKNDDDPKNGLEHCSVSLEFAEAGEFRLALREASKTLYLGIKKDKSYFMAIGTRNLAMAYSYANDLINAERFAHIAIDSYFSEGIKVVGPAYKVLGDIRMRQARYKEATEYYVQGLDFSPEWMEPMLLASMARSYALTNQYEKAHKYYLQAAEQAANSPPITRTTGMKGVVGKPGTWMQPTLLRGRAELAFLQKEYDKAISLYDDVKQAAADDAYQDIWIYAGKARALWEKNDKTAALSTIEKAISSAESLRAEFRSEEIKVGLFSNIQTIFDEAINMYMAEGKYEQALLISEKSRARALLDMVRNRVSLSNGTKSFADPMRQVAEVKQIQSSIPKNTDMVVFHSNPKRTYAWVINKKSVKAVILEESRSGLANKVRQLQRKIRYAGNIDVQTKMLYQTLIQPLGLIKNKNLLIVPHKAMHFLPFQALQSPNGYLIENHQIHQVPSASILTLKKPKSVKNIEFLALGNPKLSSPKYNLPGAQAEVEAIAKLYEKPKVYLREEATSARVIEEGPGSQIIHIAAHAEVDEMDPLYSRILLASDTFGAKEKNLHAKDIYQLDLHNTALVVLSACRSGLGNVTGGDELFGFTRTFISAGADGVIVSLWDVEDKSTATLMTNFYRSAQKIDLPAAMQQAQIALLKNPKTSHPRFWAAFNMIGAF